MATKKATAAKKLSTAMVPWTEKFKGYAKDIKEQTKNIGTGGVGISFGRGEIKIGNAVIKGGRMECVIVGSCALNKYYLADFDPSDRQPPDCYAFSVISDDPNMHPSDSVAHKQSDLCKDCEQNQFGTAKVGRGKACSNTIRLGILTAKDAEDAADIATAELATGGVSPTNLGDYKKYVDMLDEEYGRPPWAVVTEISSHNDPKRQIRLEFKMVSLIDDDDILQALEKRFLKIQDVLQKPFAAPTEKVTKKPAAGKNQKFAGKKQAARR